MRKKSVNNLHDQQKPRRQMAYQRGSQRESSPHYSYVFLYSDGEYSGDEENIPLSKKNHIKSLPKKVEVIDVRLKSEDTLQALALRYGCTLSELKRINKIHKDNEIHAHRSIKVPVPPFSVLTESIKNEKDTEQKQEKDNSTNIIEVTTTSRENEIINLISKPIINVLPQPEVNNTILNSACDTSSSCLESSELTESTEQDQLLSNAESGSVNSVNHSLNENCRCFGTQWGFSWIQLLGVSLLLGFAGPLIYLLYLSESFSKHRSTITKD